MRLESHPIDLDVLDQMTDVDAVCLFVGEEDRPLRGLAGLLDWRLCGQISRILLDQFFSGREDDHLLMPTAQRVGPARIFVIGLGRETRLTIENLGDVLQNAAQILSRAKVTSVALELPGRGRVEDERRAAAIKKRFLPAFSGERVAVLAEKELFRYFAT